MRLFLLLLFSDSGFFIGSLIVGCCALLLAVIIITVKFLQLKKIVRGLPDMNPLAGKTANITSEIGSGMQPFGQALINENDAQFHYPYEENSLDVQDSEMNLMLIVEDNDESREFIKEGFSASFRILEASNGLKGLEIAMQYIPDIIISDVLMPEMDGNELCSKLKSSTATCHIPVILLTARSAVNHKVEGYLKGADDYVTKPFSASLLTARVNNLLKSRLQLKTYFARTLLLKPQEIPEPTSDTYFLNQLVNVIEKFAGEPDFDVNKLAAEFNFSRAVLYRKVKGLTNLSLVELIRKVRLNRAAGLLNTKQYRVSEVAFMVGFNDLKHFRNCFKEQFHVSPSEMIKGENQINEL